MSRMIRLFELFLQMQLFLAMMIGFNLGIIGKQEGRMWESFLILIAVVLCYLFRRKIKNFTLFVLLHLGMVFATAFFAQNDKELVFYFIAVAIVCAYSMWVRTIYVRRTEYQYASPNNTDMTDESRDEQALVISSSEHISVYACLVMLIFCFIANSKNVNSIMLNNCEIVLFVTFILSQVIYNQIKEISREFFVNKGKTEFPKRQIIRTNVYIISVVCAFMVVGMILFYNGRYGNIFTLIGSAFLGLFRIIIKLVLMLWGSGPTQDQTEIPDETESQIEHGFAGEADGGYSMDNPAMNAMFEVVLTMLVLALAVSFIILIRRYSVRFRKNKYEDGDEIEFLEKENQKKTISLNNSDFEERDSNNLNKKYRKIYKKYAVRGNKQNQIEPSMMPENVTRQRITKDKQAGDRITISYEKARYSRDSITKEELDFLKNYKPR